MLARATRLLGRSASDVQDMKIIIEQLLACTVMIGLFTAFLMLRDYI